MKWRIHKNPHIDTTPWVATGWVWAESIGDWVRCHAYRPTHTTAIEAMNELSRARPRLTEEQPC